MFPLRDDNPTLRLPVATIAIIAINLFVWVVVQGLGAEGPLVRSICTFGLIPAELLGSIQPGSTVALSEQFSCVVGDPGSWLTPFTSMFMHGSWFHIIGNLWFLWVFGNNIEDVTGRIRFVLFYLLCGLAAAGAQMLSDPASAIPMVGASGAIGGVMGAYAVLYPKTRVHTLIFLVIFIRVIPVPAILMLGYWFVLQIVSGLPTLGGEGGGVAFWAHVGGFVAGVLLIFVFRNHRLVQAHKDALARRPIRPPVGY